MNSQFVSNFRLDFYPARPLGSIALGILTMCLFACTPTSSSNDANFTVVSLVSPAGPDSGEANLSTTDTGEPLLSWLEHGEPTTKLRYATLQDGQWSPAQTVAEGDDWLVNWADFPAVVPITGNLWAAQWLRTQAGPGFAYDVAVSISTDAGKSWHDAVQPHDDGTASEHGFVSLFGWQSGVGTIWLDGRNMVKEAAMPGGITLRSAVLHASGDITDEQVADDLVCDCCQTDVAMAREGPVVVYRDRTSAEIRDIYVMRSVNDEWQEAKAVAADGWEISGCPVNGPSIAADEDRVAVAWYTAAQGQPKVQLAWSNDGAATFMEPLRIDIGAVMGRVSVVLADDDSAIVGWLRRGGSGDGEICVRKAYVDGRLGEIKVIAHTELSRPSGFPQLALAGDKLVLARTDISGAKPQVVTSWVDVKSL